MTATDTPYYALTPDLVMDAVEAVGFVCDYRIFPLNSYENRVYQVGIEGGKPLVAKFYRPGRWSDAQILEEHAFCAALAEAEIPVVTALDIGGQHLFRHGDFRFSLYPRVGGYPPELDNPDVLFRLGQQLGRLHNVGAAAPFRHRLAMSLENRVLEPAELIAANFIPAELRAAYDSLVRDLLPILRERWAAMPTTGHIRLHGDFHVGNILWRDDLPWLVDFDDAAMGPAMQDIWLLLSGDRHAQRLQLAEIAEGYETFRDFPREQLPLVETLRTMRQVHYAGWLARRWEDPAFRKNFPWFNTSRYWSDHILELREQLAALREPPLDLP